MEPKVKIGSANLHRAQRYAHKDPAPHLPFEEIEHSATVSAVWAAIALVAGAALIVVAGYVS